VVQPHLVQVMAVAGRVLVVEVLLVVVVGLVQHFVVEVIRLDVVVVRIHLEAKRQENTSEQVDDSKNTSTTCCCKSIACCCKSTACCCKS
jgi:hypothetical protein